MHQLGLAAVARTGVRRQTGQEQNFRAQVVAETGQKTLIKIERGKTATGKALVLQTRGQRVGIKCRIQKIRSETVKKSVLALGCRIQQRHVGGAVKQSAVAWRVQRHAQGTVRCWPVAPLAGVPTTVELVVAVETQPRVETREHGFATRVDGGNASPGQASLRRFELWKGKPHLLQRLADQHLGDAVGREPDFRSFRHPSRAPGTGVAHWARASLMAATKSSSSGFVRGLNSLMNSPSRPIRYLWKFQDG